MAIIDIINNLQLEKKQMDDTLEVRALLQGCLASVVEINSRIQAIVDAGTFDTIPIELKTTLTAAWNATKSAQTTLSAGDVGILLNWKS